MVNKKPTMREHPISRTEIEDYVKNVKGLSPAQKEKFIQISQQTAFIQYAKNSLGMLKKIVKTVKKQVKEIYNKKGERQDERGTLELKQKGTTKKQMKEKVNMEKNPIGNAITKNDTLTRTEKEKKRRFDLALKEGVNYSDYEVHEGKNSKRSIAYRARNNIKNRGEENGK